MKIEKINDKQIRCILTKQDLEERKLQLSELAYGSDKARELFQEMMRQAMEEYGFESENIPLMIEAIPLSAKGVLLIITKVDYPDALDPRFSKFTKADEEAMEHFSEDNNLPLNTEEEPLNFQPLHSNGEVNLSASSEYLVRGFSITSLEKLFSLTQALSQSNVTHCELYKEPEGTYLLYVFSTKCAISDYNKACNIISEYGNPVPYSPARLACLKEHQALLFSGNLIEAFQLQA